MFLELAVVGFYELRKKINTNPMARYHEILEEEREMHLREAITIVLAEKERKDKAKIRARNGK